MSITMFAKTQTVALILALISIKERPEATRITDRDVRVGFAYNHVMSGASLEETDPEKMFSNMPELTEEQHARLCKLDEEAEMLVGFTPAELMEYIVERRAELDEVHWELLCKKVAHENCMSKNAELYEKAMAAGAYAAKLEDELAAKKKGTKTISVKAAAATIFGALCIGISIGWKLKG